MRRFTTSLVLALMLAVPLSTLAAPDGAPPTKAAAAPAAAAPTSPAVTPAATPDAPAAAGETKPPLDPIPPKPVVEPDTQQWWEYGLANLMKLGFLILTIMLLVFVKVLMKKFGFEEYSGKVNEILAKAAGYAEQKALAASKLEDGKLTPGAEKMKMAVDLAKSLAVQYKVKEKGETFWEDQLEGWLGTKKMEAEAKAKPTDAPAAADAPAPAEG